MKLNEQDKNLIERIFGIDTEIYVPTFSFVYKDDEDNCENTLSNVLGDNANIVTKKYSISNDAVLLIVENEDTDNGYTCICIKGKILDLEPQEILKNISTTPVYAVYSTYAEEDKYKICLTSTTSEEGKTIENKITTAYLGYTSFLINTAHTESVEVAAAAILPCFWIYNEIGKYIKENAVTKNNPYKKWIDTYADEETG